LVVAFYLPLAISYTQCQDIDKDFDRDFGFWILDFGFWILDFATEITR
jgi:hypothetical protein